MIWRSYGGKWLVSLTVNLIIVCSRPIVAQGLSNLSAQEDEHHQEAKP